MALIRMLASIAKRWHWLIFGIIVAEIQMLWADITILNQRNRTVDKMFDAPADFGPPFGHRIGLRGKLVMANPQNACTEIDPPPHNSTSSLKWIALVRRHDCNFDIKVLNAQKSGYQAVVVYNTGSNEVEIMHGTLDVGIPSCFVGEDDGITLLDQFCYESGYTLLIDNEMPLNPQYYLLPFAIVVGVCFILMVIFMLVKWVRDIRKRRKSRLSAQHLKKIPIKKFKKGDDYDVCAICLDDYEEGDKMRILPCSHAYHVKCVDPWLLNNKRTCPVCKRKVIPGDDPEDTETDSDDDGGRGASEVTPLLSAPAPRIGNTFESSGLPAAFRNQVLAINDNYSDSDESPTTLVSMVQQQRPPPAQLKLTGFLDGSPQSGSDVTTSAVHGLKQPDNDSPKLDDLSAQDGALGGELASTSRQSPRSTDKPIKNKSIKKKKKKKSAASSVPRATDGENDDSEKSRSLPIETEVLIRHNTDGHNSDDNNVDIV